MRIQKKRIRRLEINLIGVNENTSVRAAFPIDEMLPSALTRAGFTSTAVVGEQILPSIVGPITRYNAEGRCIIHRDQPKETCYRQHQWTHSEWHGPHQVEVTKMVDIPYQRYPRTQLPPPSIELTITELSNGKKAVVAPAAIYDASNPDPLLLNINLLLELFLGCDVLNESLIPVGVVPTISLNWEILPSGKMPWSKLQPLLAPVLDGQKKGKIPVVEYRLETISKYGPEFTAVGHGGFSGYVIFGFPELRLFVLECARYANATYVLGGNWEELAQLTKAEILDQNLHEARLIHVECWADRIQKLLGRAGGTAKAA